MIVEAQANGLPVICLDLGGPCTLVNQSSAIVIKTADQNEDQLVEAICQTLTALADDDARRTAMSISAIKHARENMSWEGRATGVLELMEGAINGR